MSYDSESQSNFGTKILAIYLFISQLYTLLNWWQYIKADSFITSITIDPILAELKGLLWIVFIWL
jgi:hypothetical protein